MIKHIIIENDREVDIVYTEEQLAQRQELGWKFVVDCSAYECNQALEKAHKIANLSGKKCHLPKPVSEQERRRILCRVYQKMFRFELWNMLGELYQKEPKKALELAQEVLKVRSSKSDNNPG